MTGETTRRFKEPDPQRDLAGKVKVKKDGSTVMIRGKGPHMARIAKDLRGIGFVEVEKVPSHDEVITDG
jgi:hypothetical protein